MSCINKPRYYEIVDPSEQSFVLVALKMEVDKIRLEARARSTGMPFFQADLTVEETNGLVAALLNCTVVPPLPSLDYVAAEDAGQVVMTRQVTPRQVEASAAPTEAQNPTT